MEAQEEDEKAAVLESRYYRNAYEYPDLITPEIIAEGQEANRKVITAFGNELYAILSSRDSTGEELCTSCSFSTKTRPKGLT